MIELILDTSHIGLNIGILKHNVLIEKVEIEASRKQSELTMPLLEELFTKNEINPQNIQKVIITEGPGSFTGLRIAMTIAKVLCSMLECDLYTINTLVAYVNPKIEKGLAIMDARGKRAYVAKLEKGKLVGSPTTIPLQEIDIEGYQIFGDAHLLNLSSEGFSIIDNIIDYRDQWKKVDDIDALVPLYLKDNKEYGN